MQHRNKSLIIYPVILIMIMTAIMGIHTDNSYAAQTFKVSHGTKWVQGENIDSGLRIETSDGRIAYCINQGKASPSGAYTDTMNLGTKLKAVLYYGYPNAQEFGSISLTKDQARCATQLAVWSHNFSGKGNRIDLDKLHGDYSQGVAGVNVLKAAKWISNKAEAGYKSPTKPNTSKPTLSQPTDKTPKYFNATYVRVGPYKISTNNGKHTSSHKTVMNLTQSPAGSYIGDKNGNTVKAPAAGTDFYVYIPSAKLTTKGTSLFKLTASYDYKYERAATFEAYKKESTQNVAIGAKLNYTEGTAKLDGTAQYKWTTYELKKKDKDNPDKVISDTEFEIYYDPTPQNAGNNDWQLMYRMKTDKNGIIKVPGLGIGTYMLKETKSNPDYALNSEFGENDYLIFKITDVSNASVQTMTNRLIGVSCEIDKDTIKKTSAAYRSLPGQENIDNVGNETYRYHLDYRSTSNVWADEFVVDDPLEGVAANQIRITELWTPISHGDYDGKMNIWYKTNKTDDSVDYSDVNAVSSNPASPNNPSKDTVKKNTGYKLWAQNVSTDTRTNLKVVDLGLDDDEYITALRLEHGRVERGFTTKNYKTDSMNNDEVVDWTPQESDPFFTEASRDAEGLKPLTYLVICPNPLSPPEVIKNSADVFIARNIHLQDEDNDEVFTEVIDTFMENGDKEGAVLGEEAEDTNDESVKGQAAQGKTGDGTNTALLVALLVMAGAIAVGLLVWQIRHRKTSGSKMLSILIVAVLLAGTFGFAGHTGSVEAATKSAVAGKSESAGRADLKISGSFVKNNMTYSLVKTSEPRTGDGFTSCNVSYKVDETVSATYLDSVGSSKIVPKAVAIKNKDCIGVLSINDREITPLYTKVKAQIDKTEVLRGLEAEDITHLPQSKVFTVRSDASANATVDKELKRAGISLKVAEHDSDGIPNKWDATIVYRGVENYLEANEYNVKADYSGRVSNTKAVSMKEYEGLNDEEVIEKYQEELIKGTYDEALGIERIESPEPIKSTGGGFTTGDLIKGLLVLCVLAGLGFLGFTKFHRKKGKIAAGSDMK